VANVLSIQRRCRMVNGEPGESWKEAVVGAVAGGVTAREHAVATNATAINDRTRRGDDMNLLSGPMS
jgi:hypothetical protein